MNKKDIKILELIYQFGIITRKELGEQLGISQPAISKKVKYLADKKWISTIQKILSEG